ISDDLLASNWFNDEKIRPAKTDNAAIDCGILTAVLKPASWNVIIIGK
ncbi:MAG: hypothetical protein GX827_09695, partial [Clostridiales bacterium]|nr:hypothetical protein [Clostridiales bacterium]